MVPFVLLLVTLHLRLTDGVATIPGATAKAKILEIHNGYRCVMCDTPALVWDDAIAENAKDYMDTGAARRRRFRVGEGD